MKVQIDKSVIERMNMLLQWISETPHQRGSINGMAAQVSDEIRAALAAQEPAQAVEPEPDNMEEWERLAWALCAEEHGEEACTELIWEGGAIPEPWGDRWLKYEGEAKRLIALVAKHTHPAPAKPLSDEHCDAICDALDAWSAQVAPHDLGLLQNKIAARPIIRDALGIKETS